MRYLFLLTYLLFLRFSAPGQDPDSLMQLAGTLPEQDTRKVTLLNEAGIAFWKSGNDSIATARHREAIEIAKRIPFPEGEIEARLQLVLMEMEYLSDLKSAYAHLDSALSKAKEIKDRSLEGQTYFRRAQLYSCGIWEYSEEVRPLYDKALEIFREVGDKSREGMVYAQLAGLEADEGRFAAGIDYLLRARRLQESSGDLKSLRATIPNLGVMYMNIGLFDHALRCFDEAEQNAKKLNDERVLAFLPGQRGEAYLKQGKPGLALRELEEAEKRYQKLGAVQFLTGTYARMGVAYLRLDNTGKALFYAAKADSLFKAITDGADLLSHSAQMVLGDVLLQKGQYQEVIKLAEKGLEWAESSDPVLLKEASEYHRQLALAFEKTGSQTKALDHHKRFKAMSDSLLNSEMIQRVTASSLEYEFEKTQQTDQLRIQALENRNLVQTRNIIITLLVLGMSALLFVFWINRRLKRKNEELTRKNEEIRLALHKGQNIERKRVASELHDSLNTKIAGIRWQLESLDRSNLSDFNQKIIYQLLDITGKAYDDIRLISHNMLPAELEKKGLTAALQRLVMQLEALKGPDLMLRTNHTERLPVEIEHQLYHITLELINNVIKHAKASSIIISLEKIADRIELAITDNGIGFSVDDGQPLKGMGLENVQNRAVAMGGTCSINNNPEGGTTVKVVIPYDPGTR